MSQGYIDTIYDTSRTPFTSYPLKLAYEISKRCGLTSGLSLLDLGCGRGELSSAFNEIGLLVTSCDREPIISKYFNDIYFEQVDFEIGSLPFDDNCFDVIFSKSVIEHLHDPLRVWRELYRVLKPGGLIITLCPSWEYNYRWYYEDFTHVSPFQKESLEDIHTIAGFVDVEVNFFKQLPILWTSYSFLFRPLSAITRSLVPHNYRRSNKWVRFSKEIMLLSIAYKR